MAYDNQTLANVWAKGEVVSGNNPAEWRKDACGAWIGWDFYGNRNSEYGWEVDHIQAVNNSGGDSLSNLRPLQWENNASKQDGRLVCVITSSGVHNAKRQ